MRNLLRVDGRTLAPFCLSLILAGCGGGGGGSSSAAPAVAAPAPSASPASSPAGPAATTVARADVLVALGVAQSTITNQSGSQLLSATRTAVSLARAAKTGSRSTSAAGTCSSGALTGGSYQFSQSTDSAGNTLSSYATFYDAACTQKQLVELITTPPGAGTGNGTATITTYDRTGALTGTGTLKIVSSFNNAGQTTTITITALNATGAPAGQLGLTCFVSSTSTLTSCGFAVISNAGTPTGMSMNLSETYASTGSQNSTYTDTIAAGGYTGTGMAIAQGSGPAWLVTGGTQVANITGSASQTQSGSIVTGGSLSLTDSTNGYTIAGTFTGTGMTATVAAGGKTLATVVTDANGSGTVTYADGSTQQISGWAITA